MVLLGHRSAKQRQKMVTGDRLEHPPVTLHFKQCQVVHRPDQAVQVIQSHGCPCRGVRYHTTEHRAQFVFPGRRRQGGRCQPRHLRSGRRRGGRRAFCQALATRRAERHGVDYCLATVAADPAKRGATRAAESGRTTLYVLTHCTMPPRCCRLRQRRRRRRAVRRRANRHRTLRHRHWKRRTWYLVMGSQVIVLARRCHKAISLSPQGLQILGRPSPLRQGTTSRHNTVLD